MSQCSFLTHSLPEMCQLVSQIGLVVCTVSLQQEGPGFDSQLEQGLCVEFTYSPYVCVGFLRVLRFPPTIKTCMLGTLA